MNILFDGQIFGLQRYGGISRYVVELRTALATLPGVRAGIVAPLHINAFLATAGETTSSPSWFVPTCRQSIRRALDALMTEPQLALRRCNVLHATYYLRRRRPFGASRLVVTVHDMIHELFPSNFRSDDSTRELKRAAVLAADHVICVSENTRQDLCRLLRVPIDRTSVVHHGVAARSYLPDTGPPLQAGLPYLLYVGARGGYKNFSTLLRALAGSPALRSRFRIVAFGGGPMATSEREELVGLGLAADAVLHIAGDDATLTALYRSAACFVCPSRYEGFGMPLLEAMVASCPVVAAAASSLPEVSGPAAEYFDVNARDADLALAAAIERVVDDSARHAELIRLGRTRAATFTWHQAALQTLRSYQTALSGA